jgi:hypothetical protein
MDIATNYGTVCMLNPDGSTECIFTEPAFEYSPPTVSLSQIELAGAHGCGLSNDGEFVMWNGPDFLNDSPVGPFSDVDCSEHFACGISATDSTIECWGSPDDWYISLGLFDPPEGTFESLSIAADHACALSADGNAHCWGNNYWGQATSPRFTTFTAIDTGTQHTCGITSGNEVVCWGEPTGAGVPPF